MLRIYRTSELGLREGVLRQRLTAVARLWLRRSRTRQALAALNDHELREIGLTRDDAKREIGRPFWDPWLS
jgi:uncharacterized protein YjiS (DUF1127 family)